MYHEILKVGTKGRQEIGGAPDGCASLLVAELALLVPHAVMHVAIDDLRMTRMAEWLSFVSPGLDVVMFPAWDCLPYDRASPHRDILARRIDGLSRLARWRNAPAGGRVLVTTIAAILQRVPAPASIEDQTLELRRGQTLDQLALVEFLTGKGYARAGTVGEAGEFAVRGGIIDLFPPGTPVPLRVDFLGDEIEAIRNFDPITQRSLGPIEQFTLRPINEVSLTKSAIETFRAAYRAEFGVAGGDDPLYEAISAGRHYPGMEHWLPLFGIELQPLDSYLPHAILTLDHQIDEAVKARLEMIADFHQARRDLQGAERESGGAIYRPLAPSRLYLSENGWAKLVEGHVSMALHPFAAPEGHWLSAKGRFGRNYAAARADPSLNLYEQVARDLRAEQQAGRRILLSATSAGALDRLTHLLVDHGLASGEAIENWEALGALAPGALGHAITSLEAGFATDNFLVVTEQDILGDRLTRIVARKKRPDAFMAELANFHAGDIVVHVDHGIARYEGLESLDVGGAPHDCLRLIYDGGDKLFVPVENIDVLSRYGNEDTQVALDKLGGAAWQARKARVKQRIRDIADRLLKTAARRQLKSTDAATPPEGAFDEFCARFPYEETEDQQRAIGEVLADLAAGKPMDRLICGDVGFGKTEVALRAAFVIAMAGRQVAIVTPTTLLCRQHYQTFGDRFHGLPFTIRQISRLVAAKDAARVKEEVKSGRVDIVIGTHALLSRNIGFADLGLLIVDEEQHFGVAQKERLKEMRGDVHVLTLTATPIPRTLQLALSGIREMSLITTPPVDRLAVRTFVLPFDPVIVREAIMREHFRGGQVFYVCPRIEDLDEVAERLRRLVPEIKFGIAHGRLPAAQLEATMTAFYDGGYDLLLATNIIESGLDIPNANTLVIHRADMFGLAQLYQLRGRIGRSKLRGYAYLTTPPGKTLTEAARRRLEVMQTLDQLGAGFSLASHDLDIRGAGNLLGEEQSGQVREVGVELYQQLLEEAVRAARGEVEMASRDWSPQINLGMPILIPEGYVQDLNLRLALYRRIAELADDGQGEAFAAELIDRFGTLPGEVANLLQVVAIKRLCKAAGIDKLDAGPKGCVMGFRENRFARPERLVEFITRRPDRVTLRTDHRLVYRQDWSRADQRIRGARQLAQELAALTD